MGRSLVCTDAATQHGWGSASLPYQSQSLKRADGRAARAAARRCRCGWRRWRPTSRPSTPTTLVTLGAEGFYSTTCERCACPAVWHWALGNLRWRVGQLVVLGAECVLTPLRPCAPLRFREGI